MANTATVLNETADQKIARLMAENAAMQKQIDNGFHKPGTLKLKVSEKGALSVYGLGRFPVTLYKEQWGRLLDETQVKTMKTFIRENDKSLKAKGD